MHSSEVKGVAFPVVPDGSRSTMRSGALILAAALEPVDAAAAGAALAETRWRRTCPHHFCKLVEGGLTDPAIALASARAGLASARAGLASARQTLTWERGDGPSTLAEAMAEPSTALAHPFELFMDNACSGRLWTMAHRPRSASPVAAALGWVRQKVSA